MTETRYIKAADTAKLVRKALAEAFPGFKFSIRSKSYSMGASINVSWTDGPTGAEVEAITGAFTGATFDGMTDYKGGKVHSFNGESVHFGADFIFCRRDLSPGFLEKVGKAWEMMDGRERCELINKLPAWSRRDEPGETPVRGIASLTSLIERKPCESIRHIYVERTY